MSQNYQIGKQFSGSFNQRLEWRLNQLQLAIDSSANGGGSSPALEALLTDLLAVTQVIQGQTDGLELTSENISLNADAINLNTDQVEALLAAIDAHIVALQTQVGDTSGLEALLIDVRDRLLDIVTSTAALELIADSQDDALQIIAQEFGGSTGTGGVIFTGIIDRLSQINTGIDTIAANTSQIISLNELIREDLKPLVFNSSGRSNVVDYPPGNAFVYSPDPLRRGLKIINASGESDNGIPPIAGECWIFGSYQDANVDQNQFDFVIEPGRQVLIDSPASEFWLCCIAQTQAAGTFVYVEYR